VACGFCETIMLVGNLNLSEKLISLEMMASRGLGAGRVRFGNWFQGETEEAAVEKPTWLRSQDKTRLNEWSRARESPSGSQRGCLFSDNWPLSGNYRCGDMEGACLQPSEGQLSS
jgi:hypothetical protein